MDHTIVEKGIKRDIVRKNTILKKIQRMNAKVIRWQAKAKVTGNRRRQKKYRATVRRFLEEISRLRPGVQKMIEDLDARIHEELNFSQEEVRTFKGNLAKEKTRMAKVAGELEAVEEKLKKEEDSSKAISDEDDSRAQEIQKELKKDQARARRLKKKEEREARQVEDLKGELKSEAVDKKIMVAELERIEKEKELIAALPAKEEAEAEPK